MQQLREKWLGRAIRLKQRNFPTGLFSQYLIIGAMMSVFGFLTFFILTSRLLKNELFNFDKLVSQWMISFRTDWFTRIMLFITNLASAGWLIGLVLLVSIVGLYCHKRIAVLFINIVAIGAQILTDLLKITFQRSRPSVPWLTIARGYSFPSGHTLVSLAIYGILAYLVFRTTKQGIGKYVLGIGLLFVPILIGISRIYLGVHYPSDVLAGWAVAMGWCGICVTGIEYLKIQKNYYL
jgi:membrane-associated phospholipid phosphatase